MTVYNQDNRDLNIEVEGKTQKDQYGNNYVLLAEIEKGSFEELSKPFHIKLKLLSPSEHPPLASQEMLGRNTTIKLKKSDGSWRLFNGIVSNFILNGYYTYSDTGRTVYNTDLYEYKAVLSPKMLLMQNSIKSRVFHSKKPTEIVEGVLAEWNIDYDDRLLHGSTDDTRKYYQIEQVVQYEESDLDFISRLMEKDGIFYDFWQGEENQNPVHKLVLRDSNPNSELNLIYDYQGNQDAVLDFKLGEKVGPANVRIDNYDYRQADVTFFNYDDSRINQGTDLGTYAANMQVNRFSTDFVGVTDKTESSKYRKKLKKLDAERFRNAGYEWSGSTKNRALSSGTAFTMTGYPTGDIKGLITRLEFAARTTPFSMLHGSVTRDLEAGFEAYFYAQELGNVFRPQLTIQEPKVFSTTNAKVITVENIPAKITDFNSDLGGNPLWVDPETNRIKILMNWRNTLPGKKHSPDVNSMWLTARFGQLWADPYSGKFDIPRKGQEVLVSFINGNLAQPVVIGSLYNSVVKPPIDTAVTNGAYGSIMRSAAITAKQGEYSAKSFTQNSMPLPMSAYDLGQSGSQKGYSEISIYSVDNKQFANAAYNNKAFFSKWFFPGAAPPVTDFLGILDAMKGGSAGKNMFFEGINMYSNKDVMSQATQRQVINAGSDVQIAAGNSITLQVGRSKIAISDQGIVMTTIFGDEDRYAGYVTAYTDVDPKPPAMPKWSYGSNSSLVVLQPGAGVLHAPLAVLEGTYLTTTKTIWGSECGALVGHTFVKGLNTEVSAGFDAMGFFDFFSKVIDAVMNDVTNLVKSEIAAKDGSIKDGTSQLSIYQVSGDRSILWIILGAMLINGVYQCVKEAVYSIKMMFTWRASRMNLACDKVEVSGQNVHLDGEKNLIRGNPMAPYLKLLDDLKGTMAPGGDLLENEIFDRVAPMSEEEINLEEVRSQSLSHSRIQLEDSSTSLNSTDESAVDEEVNGGSAEANAGSEQAAVADLEQSVVDDNKAVSASELSVHESSTAALVERVRALDTETQALIQSLAGMDLEL
ncbi:type VI secretion system tip protein TssI/VgrG [Lentisphaerota bacterium ZTH]|nr:type VI secretion system tip protein VgrG [Lentisphaerota bacterium]WET06012.1 type VI secretion system tip protein TssI/VgrG [Lentisphaerota bacterium ZTH]